MAFADHDAQGPAEEVEGDAFAPLLIDLDFSRIAPSRTFALPDPPEGMVTVQLLGVSEGGDIPGKFRFFMAAPEVSQLFTTLSLPAGQKAPRGRELFDGIAFLEPGKFYSLQVIYRNRTKEEIQFLVTAPTIDPQAALPFARARCWCASIPFSAPPGGTFARTIQVGVAPDTPPGAKVIVIWPVVRLN